LNLGVFSCWREYDSSFLLGGGQHGMAKPYSEDLRARVVAAIEAGATTPEVADQYSVSLSSVGRFVRLDRETGSVSAAKFGGYKEFALAGHEALVRQLVAKQPDITLAELVTQLAKKITIGKSSVSRFLHHLKLSFKKKSAGHRAGSTGRRRSA
jgi:transposase